MQKSTLIQTMSPTQRRKEIVLNYKKCFTIWIEKHIQKHKEEEVDIEFPQLMSELTKIWQELELTVCSEKMTYHELMRIVRTKPITG